MAGTTGYVRLTFEVAGERQFHRRMDGWFGNLDDLSPAWKAIAADYRATMKARFAAEGAVDGEPRWEPLGARYARRKARLFPGKLILEATGKLREAATDPEEEITATSLTLTIAGVPYAIYHQAKGRGKAQYPRRPFASIARDQKSRWFAIVRRHIFDES